MFNLLKVEFYKLKKFPFGYIVLLLFLGIGIIGGGYKFPYSFENTADVFAANVCDTSLVFTISLAVAFFMGKDFSGRTIDNEIKLGYSRYKILLSKMIAVCSFAAFIHTVWVAVYVLSFAVVRGFDSSVLCVENALWLITVLIQLSAVISGVILITFTARTVGGAIAISSMYVLICCNILRNYTDAKIFTMSPFCFVQNNDSGNLAYAAVNALVTMAVFLIIAIFTFNKAEVK